MYLTILQGKMPDSIIESWTSKITLTFNNLKINCYWKNNVVEIKTDLSSGMEGNFRSTGDLNSDDTGKLQINQKQKKNPVKIFKSNMK